MRALFCLFVVFVIHQFLLMMQRYHIDEESSTEVVETADAGLKVTEAKQQYDAVTQSHTLSAWLVSRQSNSIVGDVGNDEPT